MGLSRRDAQTSISKREIEVIHGFARKMLASSPDTTAPAGAEMTPRPKNEGAPIGQAASFSNKIALITGGDSGIGRWCIARKSRCRNRLQRRTAGRGEASALSEEGVKLSLSVAISTTKGFAVQRPHGRHRTLAGSNLLINAFKTFNLKESIETFHKSSGR